MGLVTQSSTVKETSGTPDNPMARAIHGTNGSLEYNDQIHSAH